MKSRLFLILLVAGCMRVFGQDVPPQKLLPAGYYIVVASYKTEPEASKYLNEANQKKDFHFSAGLDEASKVYFVFIDHFGESDASFDKMILARKEAGFGGAWVRVLKNGKIEKMELQTQARQSESKKEEPKSVTEVTQPVASATATEEEPAQAKMDPVKLPHTMKNTPVFFSLYNSQSNKVVNGEVQVIDGDRNVLIKKAKGNDYLSMPDPKNSTGKILLVAEVLGYRKTEREVNYKEIISRESEKYKEMFGNFILMDFEMVRYGIGDMATLNNVNFYSDAAVMMPESKTELDNLLALMDEKPYKIVIHGHTNGNSQGKIITMGPSKNFFALTKDDKQGFGSAKDLSKERAQTIKDWLVANGVAADRIDVKGWGGGKMIYDKNSVNARKNVRVELEIVSN